MISAITSSGERARKREIPKARERVATGEMSIRSKRVTGIKVSTV